MSIISTDWSITKILQERIVYSGSLGHLYDIRYIGWVRTVDLGAYSMRTRYTDRTLFDEQHKSDSSTCFLVGILV